MKALLVDAYNLIYAHPELAPAMQREQEEAREGLIRELSPLSSPDYFEMLVIVFDAAGSIQPEPVLRESGGITVVFTRRGQSADDFIEGLARRLLPAHEVTVASSDRTLVGLVGGFGARTVPGPSLLELAKEAQLATREDIKRIAGSSRNPLEERIGEEVRRLLDEMRYT
jgi:predicted RNA-binding protein with PIN domain